MKYSQISFTVKCIIFLFTFSSTAYCQSNIEVFRILDVTKNISEESYYIGFYARKGLPGHAFVVLGQHKDNLCSLEHAVGFYPKEGNKKEFFLGEPEKINEGFPIKENLYIDPKCFEDNCPTSLERTTHAIVFRVDKDKYTIAKNIIDNYIKNPEKMGLYSAIINDCITFIVEIGEAIGLNINRSDAFFPQSYINSMISRTSPLSLDSGESDPLLMDGKKIIDFSNGTFIGTTIQGRRFTGEGIFNGKNKNDLIQYIGEFKNGTVSGRGKAIFKNYELEGNFLGGSINGAFTYKTIYQGDKITVKAVMHKRKIDNNEVSHITCSSGWSYSGQINERLVPDGAGRFEYSNGKRLIGSFKNGNSHGTMKLINSDGSSSTWNVNNDKISSYKEYDKYGQQVNNNSSSRQHERGYEYDSFDYSGYVNDVSKQEDSKTRKVADVEIGITESVETIPE